MGGARPLEKGYPAAETGGEGAVESPLAAAAAAADKAAAGEKSDAAAAAAEAELVGA